MKYEYKVVNSQCQLTSPDLNDYGKNGWLLVSALIIKENNIRKGISYTFVREKVGVGWDSETGKIAGT